MAQPSNGFVGTYTDGASEGLYACSIDAEGRISTELAATSEDPTFLVLAPDGETLYAANNVDDGTVTAFEIDEDRSLTERTRAAVGDDGPVHVSVDASGSVALTAQYHGGSVSLLPIAPDGRIRDATAVIEHEGSSVDPDRQTEPHPHSIVPGPKDRFAYAPDLGTDEVAIYELDVDEPDLRPADCGNASVHDGAGPRHVDFHPEGDLAYLANELDSTLTVFEHDAETGALDPVATVDTIPDSVTGENYPADVHVHPDGEAVYLSNRGHDSIAVFDLDQRHHPTLVDTVDVGGEWPRHFQLTPDARLMTVENQHTDDVVTLAVDDDGGLSPTGHAVDVPEPVCLRFC
jgi:6-phosphogluconolactonase